MSNQNYFTISQDTWSLLAVGQNNAAASLQGFASSSAWNTNKTFDDLQVLINETPDGGTLDLEGQRYMAPDIGDAANYSSEPGNTFLSDMEDPDNPGVFKAITIKNGTISGTRPITWTAHPSLEGVLQGTVVSVDSVEALNRITLPQQDTSGEPTPGDKLMYLVDFRNDVQYANCVWPKSTQNLRRDYTTTYNPRSWLMGQSQDGDGVAPGTTDYQCDVYSRSIDGQNTVDINVARNRWDFTRMFKFQFLMGDVDVDGVWTENNATGTVKAPTWQAIEAELDGKDAAKLRIYIRSGPNASLDADVLSWNPVSGELEFTEVIYYSGYVNFCFAGHSDWLDPGQYYLDLPNSQIILKPFSHTAGILPASQGIEVAALPVFFYGSSKCDVTLENITFTGSSNNSGTQSMVRKDNQPYTRTEDLPDNPGTYLLPDRVVVDGKFQPSNAHRLKIDNCRFIHGGQATRGDVDISNSYFDNFREYTCVATDGATCINNYFGICERWENLTIFCQNYGADPNDGDVTVAKVDELQARFSLVKDNVFFNPITTHGQGLSIYNTAWSNSVTSHNIFVDFVRACSYQSRDDGSRRYVPGLFDFSNNIVLFDNPLEFPPAGQNTISYNGSYGDNFFEASDDASQEGCDQVMRVYNNTLLYNPLAEYKNPEDNTTTAIDFLRIYKSQFTAVNNVAAFIKISDDEANYTEQFPPATGQNRICFDMPARLGNNLSYAWDNDIDTWSATDLPNPPRGYSEVDPTINSPSTIFDYERLRVYDEYQDKANDNGAVGHRWGGNITAAKIRDMVSGNWDPYWPLKFPAESIPVPAAWVGGANSANHQTGPASDNSTPVWRGEDNRP